MVLDGAKEGTGDVVASLASFSRAVRERCIQKSKKSIKDSGVMQMFDGI